MDEEPTPNDDVSFNSKLYQQFDVRSNTRSHVQRAIDNRIKNNRDNIMPVKDERKNVATIAQKIV
jgi:hypothetical protein